MDFREIYVAHLPFVWRILRRLGVREPYLNDALQDVFLVVHRRLADFEQRSKVTTWLFRICVRVASEHRRRAHLRREVLDETCIAAEIHPGADATEIIGQNEDLQLFEAALAKVDMHQREVFILFELEDLTAEQIAVVLEIPLGTVYSRLRLARGAFRKEVLRLEARCATPSRAAGSQ